MENIFTSPRTSCRYFTENQSSVERVDNQGEYPYVLRKRNNGDTYKRYDEHWALVVRAYEDMFNYNSSMNDTPSLQCSTFVRIGAELGYT